jgi:hypothetical protein
MGADAGRRVALPPPRVWIEDLLAVSRGVPVVTIERRMDLRRLAAARAAAADRPPWVLLFAKAYAIVAARRPELRRAYVRFPWPHLYEAAESVATVAVEREYAGEPAVFFAKFRGPDRQPLARLTQRLAAWRAAPAERVKECRRLIRMAGLPRPVRRAAWWWGVHSAGRRRAKNVGTFGVSVTAAAGASCRNLLSPLATNLNYGVLGPDGAADVRLHFDHRVLDGMPAARALADLEAVLAGEVLAEVRRLPTAAGGPHFAVRERPRSEAHREPGA